MIYIENECTNPWFNLALEEYFLRMKSKDDFVSLWQNEKSVIIGRHQNVIKEINQAIASQNDIKIARRTTGGGAVYHDLGNLNFTYITNIDVEKSNEIDFKKFAIPIVTALESYGLKASIEGRNDIVLEGHKISGTAQACIGNRLMFHGTLLYNLDKEMANQVLTVSKEKVNANGVNSIKSRIGNIKDFLPGGTTIQELKERILNAFRSGELQEYLLSKNDEEEILSLSKNKYSTRGWIYGESMEADISNIRRTTGGEVEVNIRLDGGNIQEIRFMGDFLGVYSVEFVEKKLKGLFFDYFEIKKALEKIDLKKYFGDITLEDLLQCMFEVV